jgi:hypothetical protein
MIKAQGDKLRKSSGSWELSGNISSTISISKYRKRMQSRSQSQTWGNLGTRLYFFIAVLSPQQS